VPPDPESFYSHRTLTPLADRCLIKGVAEALNHGRGSRFRIGLRACGVVPVNLGRSRAKGEAAA